MRAMLWPSRALAATLATCLLGRVDGFCPQGFNDPEYFPKEWKIPVWPELGLEAAGRLRTVSFGGFTTEALNEEFLEGPGEEYMVQGKESYWQVSGKYFLFWCQRFEKWRIAGISAFGKNKNGNCYSFVSDGVKGRDINDPSLIKGWIEVEGSQWQPRNDAGVFAIGTMQDQFDALAAEDNETGECSADGGEGGEKSNCPVMPTVRKVGAKLAHAAKMAGKWVQRLFPSLLPAPSEDDEQQPGASEVDEQQLGAGPSSDRVPPVVAERVRAAWRGSEQRGAGPSSDRVP